MQINSFQHHTLADEFVFLAGCRSSPETLSSELLQVKTVTLYVLQCILTLHTFFLLDVFRENSFTITCTILKECLIAVCANTSQLMTTLVPHYAALVAALHFSVHSDIGAYMVEALTVKLVQVVSNCMQPLF